jgi:hypothetical protein
LYQEADISNKIAEYIKTVGVIRNVLKPSLVQGHTDYVFTEVWPDHYGREAWTIKKTRYQQNYRLQNEICV